MFIKLNDGNVTVTYRDQFVVTFSYSLILEQCKYEPNQSWTVLLVQAKSACDALSTYVYIAYCFNTI